MVREMSDDKSLGERAARQIEERNIVNCLIGLRTAQGLSQTQIAVLMACTQSKVSKLENGRDDDISIGDFDAYARALGLRFTIILAKRDQTLVELLKMHVNAIGDLLQRLVAFANDNDHSIKKGARRVFAAACRTLLTAIQGAVSMVKASADELPQLSKHQAPRIEVQSAIDDDDEATPICFRNVLPASTVPALT